MRKLLASILAVGLAVAACSAVAANPVGTWKGGFHGGKGKLPGTPTPAAQKTLNRFLETMRSMKVTLRLNADHTFLIDITGTQDGKPTKSRTEGKWKASGATILTTNLKRNGLALSHEAQAVNKLTLSKDGKTLTHTYDQGPVLGKIILKRT